MPRARQAMKQRRPAATDDGMNDDAVIVDEPQLLERSRELGRSLLEAPRWVSQRIAVLGERFVHSGGNPDVLDAFPEESSGETAWLDRAAHAVDIGAELSRRAARALAEGPH